MATAVVAVTRVTAVVAAVVLTVVRHVSLMVIALRVRMLILRLAQISHQALTLVALSNQHVHHTAATAAVITMIAHRAQVATLATAAISVAVKIVVRRSLIVVARTHALGLRVLMRPHVRTKVVTSVVPSAVTAHTLTLLRVTATVMIAQRALSATVIHVRLLIAHPALTRIAAIVNNVRLARQRRAANTHPVHVPSARNHSSVRNVRNTRRVLRARSSMKLVRLVTRSVLQVLLQRLRPTAAIALHVALPSRLNTLRR